MREHPKHVRISWLFVPVITTTAVCFIEISRASWFKQEIQQVLEEEEAGVDLVEIAPMAQPPVCRIMDYGKFKYQEQKRQHEQKLKQKQVQVKEVKFRPGTDENDYQIKLRNMVRFLQEDDKVKVTLRFRGREMAHQEIGMRQIERIRTDLQDFAAVEQMPKMEGRQMVMILTPSKKK